MAEFLNQVVPKKFDSGPADGFNAFGKPVILRRRSHALRHCRDMGLTDTERATACISGMSEYIERDEPYEAMRIGMMYLDQIGVYRLLAVLCCAAPDEMG